MVTVTVAATMGRSALALAAALTLLNVAAMTTTRLTRVQARCDESRTALSLRVLPPTAFEKKLMEAEMRRSKQQRRRRRGRVTDSPTSAVVVTESVVWIPVVFHVIQSGSGTGGVPTAAAVATIEEANAVYSGAESARFNRGVDMGVRFFLQGVVRWNNNKWFKRCDESEFQMKNATIVDPARVLNVWVCPLPFPSLGYSYNPFVYEETSVWNGIVMTSRSLARVPGYDPYGAYSSGRTFAHEAGHVLGLLHTFQGSCGDTPGDRVADTPKEGAPFYDSCTEATVRDTCPLDEGLDPIRNIMDYSEDSCMDSFTLGQAQRVAFEMSAFRPTMWRGALQPKCMVVTPSTDPNAVAGTASDWALCASDATCNAAAGPTPDGRSAGAAGWCRTVDGAWGQCCCAPQCSLFPSGVAAAVATRPDALPPSLLDATRRPSPAPVRVRLRGHQGKSGHHGGGASGHGNGHLKRTGQVVLDPESCLTRVSWVSARDACAARGLRLCAANELGPSALFASRNKPVNGSTTASEVARVAPACDGLNEMVVWTGSECRLSSSGNGNGNGAVSARGADGSVAACESKAALYPGICCAPLS